LLASLSSLLGIGIFTPAAIASAVALFAAKTLLDLDKARVERDSSAWSYIFKVENTLAGVS
jgi:hypothetical protein